MSIPSATVAGLAVTVLLRAIRWREAGTRWLLVAYARMAVGRHALWLRQRFGG